MPVPFAFGASTTAIPLSELDSNFNTTITLGNTAIQLGNTVTTLNNMTLANVTISSGNVTITNVTVTTANATTVNTTTLIATTANVTTGNVTNLISGNVTLTGGNITSTAISGSTGSFSTLTTSSTVTINGGTANGVAFLDGSKVLTTGSALTFDGTTLANSSGGTPFSLNRTGAGTALIELKQSGTIGGYLGTSGSNDFIIFNGSAAELARFNNTGLGIGTSSPGAKLHVAASGSQLRLGSTNTAFYWDISREGAVAGNLEFGNASGGALTTRMVLDVPGNLGLGVTPSAWGAGQIAMDIGLGSAIWNPGTATQTQVLNNSYFNNTNFIYKGTGAASRYRMTGAQHEWYTAPSGTAGNAISFTQAMTLDASGNLGLGATSPLGAFEIIRNSSSGSGVAYPNIRLDNQSATGYTGFYFLNSGTSKAFLEVKNDVGALTMGTGSTERARITSGGYFKASDNGAYFNSTGTYHEFRQTANTQGVIISATNASFTSESIFSTATKAAGTDWLHFYGTSDANTVANIKIFGNGNVQNANNSYAGISDQKLKQDIVDAGSQWDDIKSLRIRKYRFKYAPTQTLQLGLVAQEVEQTSPGLVEETFDKDENGQTSDMTTKSVKYSVVYMKAVKALQEAMARIEKLEAEVATLKGA